MKIVDLEPVLAEFGFNSVRIGISVENWPWRWYCSRKTRLQCRFSAKKVSVAGWLTGWLAGQPVDWRGRPNKKTGGGRPPTNKTGGGDVLFGEFGPMSQKKDHRGGRVFSLITTYGKDRSF